MIKESKGIIIKFEYRNEQAIGNIIRVIGVVKGRSFIPIIDYLNLDANPRSSKTGSVTDAIQESIEKEPELLPFKTKGVLLASSQYEFLERNRLRIIPEDLDVEGILDGGHNALAIGMYILKNALEFDNIPLEKGCKTWGDFKRLWINNRHSIDDYLKYLKDFQSEDLDFLIPVELLLPRDLNDCACVSKFKYSLLEICEARNNNAELSLSTKANQKGHYDILKQFMEDHNPELAKRIEWKSNDGGDIKAQDIVALSWIPLSLIEPIKDENNKIIEPVSANKLYSSKGSCMKQFERLMSSPDVSIESEEDYKSEIVNKEVISALKITAELPELYDYIYKEFPKLYNKNGGNYGRIVAVKVLNEKRKIKKSPYINLSVETLSPDGFIIPLVYGLKALMERKEVNGKREIVWAKEPMPFLRDNLSEIVSYYSGIFSICDYDPQKVGKASQSYTQAISGFKMAMAGII
ncbi:MAG: hypothetical protein J1E81_09465 [Eubacterium sp.]|nr:hypothetical protein [Eubacterium sp.]